MTILNAETSARMITKDGAPTHPLADRHRGSLVVPGEDGGTFRLLADGRDEAIFLQWDSKNFDGATVDLARALAALLTEAAAKVEAAR